MEDADPKTCCDFENTLGTKKKFRYCGVPGCPTYHPENAGFYTFPEELGRRQKWAEACKISIQQSSKQLRICWLHFQTTDFKSPVDLDDWEECNGKGFGHLKKGVVPSQRLPEDPGDLGGSENIYPNQYHE